MPYFKYSPRSRLTAVLALALDALDALGSSLTVSPDRQTVYEGGTS
jgi:hypothetical protein